MKIKPFIISIYTIAGLIISATSAFMTFIIIDEPIGQKMLIQIIFAIILVLPIIWLISYIFGNHLFKKFNFILYRLQNIKEEDFSQNTSKNTIQEIDAINQNMNFLSEQMDNLIKNLKQKNQNLSDLLISMAHDVKTPITILNGYIEELEDGLISTEDIPKALIHMKEEVEFLDELTIDMLEYISSLQNHKVKHNINIHSFIENKIFPILAKNKDILYINEIDKNIFINFNEIDLKKICINILTNALKYTQHGYIKVKGTDKVIQFENTGEEIKEEFKDKIFEPFYTISKSKNRKNTGFGLGLSIVKNLSKNNDFDCILYHSDNEKTIFNLFNTDNKLINIQDLNCT